jgi:hypothetical protein
MKTMAQVLMPIITLNSIVSIADEQISSDLAGEAIILDLKSGVYYSLDLIGARIWELMEVPRKVSELVEILVAEYEVSQTQCLRDVTVLLTDLEANNLIKIYEETNL